MPRHHAPSPVAPGGIDVHVALMSLAQLCAQLHASEHGLTQAEAQERLLASGLNRGSTDIFGTGGTCKTPTYGSDASVKYTNRQYVHAKDNLSPGALLSNLWI